MPPNYRLKHNDPVQSKEGVRALTTLEETIYKHSLKPLGL